MTTPSAHSAVVKPRSITITGTTGANVPDANQPGAVLLEGKYLAKIKTYVVNGVVQALQLAACSSVNVLGVRSPVEIVRVVNVPTTAPELAEQFITKKLVGYYVLHPEVIEVLHSTGNGAQTSERNRQCSA
jgi:hypothetical protein